MHFTVGELPARQLRDWRLVKLAGYTREQILAQPASWLDWLLAVEDAYQTAQENISKRNQARQRQPRARPAPQT